MTDTAKRLLDALERELETLPAAEQERRIASFLEDLRGGEATETEEQEDPYSALKVLRDAKLSGSTDASVTYEKKLYGPHSGSDQ